MAMLEEQVAKVHREPNSLLRKCRPNVLIDRELRTEAHGVVVKDSECCRSEEHLVCLRVCDGNVRLHEPVGTLSDELAEQTPVPFVRRPAPFRGTVAIDQAIVEHVGPAVSVVLVEFRERTAEPQVVAARRQSGDRSEHRTGRVRRMHDSVEARLRTGNYQTREGCALDASTNLCGAVLEAPRESGFEICTRLDSRGWERSISDNRWQRE